MKKGSNRQHTEVTYWDSLSDILVSLLLCILLIVLLLILYLVNIPEEIHVDDSYGDTYEQDWDDDDRGDDWHDSEAEHAYDNLYPEPERNNGGGGGGGGGDETPQPTVSPQPTLGVEEGFDKTAVFVQVVDGETQSTIKKAGVEYELYADGDMLQTLSTYYPIKIDYSKFETTADGVFYLPEKLAFGSYYLHGLSAIAGYDTSENTPFTIDESRDWLDPFVVTVELYPSRNTIRVQLKDQDSGRKLGGGAFNVIAEADVVTMDGTTRYHAGQIVDTIELDESGYGESAQLYLGKYRLEQTVVPEFYAALAETPSLTVQKSSEGGTMPLKELALQKTTIQLQLVDALYPAQGLEGAAFTLTGGGGTDRRSVTTDASGSITLDNLRENTTYRLRQTGAPGSYSPDPSEYSFVVDGKGCIDGSAQATLTLTNTLIRASIGARGMLLNGLTSDVNLALYTAEGELVQVWNTTALEQSFEGLAPGDYKLVINGRTEDAQTIQLRQTEELQQFYFRLWTTADIGIICGAAALGVGLIALLVVLIVRKRKRS